MNCPICNIKILRSFHTHILDKYEVAYWAPPYGDTTIHYLNDSKPIFTLKEYVFLTLKK